MKLCTVTPVFNEYGDHLRRNLEEQEKFGIERAYFVDGCWHELFAPKDSSGLSQDGTREIIRQFRFTKILDAPWFGEIRALNTAFKRAAIDGYSAVLQLAADEWITGDLDRMQNNLDDMFAFEKKYAYWVEFITHHITPPDQKFDRLPRLLINPMFIRIRHIHWWYYYLNKPIVYGSMIPGVKIHHDDRPRPQERENKMLLFQKWQTEHDKKLLEKIAQTPVPPSRYTDYSCGCKDGTRYYLERGEIMTREITNRCQKHINSSISKEF